MKKSFIALLILVIVISCKQNNRNNSVNELEEETEIPSSGPEIESTEPQVIERNDLVAEWANELEKISLDEKFLMEKELVENRHIKGVIDTIKTFSHGESSIKVYHTEGLYAVESAEINDPEFFLSGPVRIGMEKNQLEKVLNSELNKDFIQVKNELGTFEFNLFFRNDILQRIQFQGYVD